MRPILSELSLRRRCAQDRYQPSLEPLEYRLAPADLPAGFSEAVMASGLSSATTFELSPDGKLFVAEQAGTLEVWQNGSRLQSNFFRDTPLSVSSSGERGLLGIAFHPNYASNRYVYVYYTATSPAIHIPRAVQTEAFSRQLRSVLLSFPSA